LAAAEITARSDLRVKAVWGRERKPVMRKAYRLVHLDTVLKSGVCPTGGETGDWKVASTGRLESLPYVGTGALPKPAFKDSVKMRTHTLSPRCELESSIAKLLRLCPAPSGISRSTSARRNE